MLQALAWPSTSGEVKVKKKLPVKQASGKAEAGSSRPDKLTQEGAALEKALLAAADALLAKADQLEPTSTIACCRVPIFGRRM